MTEQPFVLDAYAARSCPLKTVHEFTPGLTAPRPEFAPPPFFRDAEGIEAEVFAELGAAVPGHADLRGLRGGPSIEHEAATLRALAEGRPLILAPLLPRDWAGHRRGRPSLLWRVADGYVPVQVKFHKVMESCSAEEAPLVYSTLAEPHLRRERPERRFRWSGRLTAALQIAHEWRLLQATGYAAGTPVAGLIGIEQLTPDDARDRRQHRVITWLDLAAPLAPPDPATIVGGEAVPVPTLDRYDHEHALRVRLASRALAGERSELAPVLHRECSFCIWQDVCTAQLPEDDLSRRLARTSLDSHELRTLRRLGIASVTDLAEADLDALLPRYLPLVVHRGGAEDRLARAARRARLLARGVELERLTTDPVDLAEHDLEIDLDIETSAEDHAYLWGFLVEDKIAGTLTYRPFAAFTDLDDAAEMELARTAFDWLRELTAGRDAAVYHYSAYEALRVQKLGAQLAEAGERGLARWSSAFADEHFVDLFALVRANFFGANGLGLKVVAQAATGFHWRDESPGGLASQTWFADAVRAEDEGARAASRVRVLEYNEDDVRATWHLRHWLRSLD